MSKGRMEAFSDGVLAIVITIMVLKLNAPESLTLDAVKEVFPTFLAYILSFIYVGIYWACLLYTSRRRRRNLSGGTYRDDRIYKQPGRDGQHSQTS